VVTPSPLQKLQFKVGQFAQLRFRPKFLVQPTGAVQDYDFQIIYPSGVQRGGFQYVNAVWNLSNQVSDPTDQILLPAQGANEGYPTLFQGLPAWEFAARTEQYLLEDDGLNVRINNNSSAITAAGALGLEVSGFVYNFVPVDPAVGTPWQFLPTVPLTLPMGLDHRDVIPIQFGRVPI
jgi:hypothetical protein